LPGSQPLRYILPNKLIESKIPPFQGTKAQNNRLVLGYIAIKGPSLPYDVFKDLKVDGYYKENQYPTVYRRIKDLVKNGYLMEAGERSTKRGKQTEETQYSITWKGFVASLAIEDLRNKILDAVERNLESLNFELIKGTSLYLGDFYPSIRKIVYTIFSESQIEAIVTILFKAYLESAAPSLDNVRGNSGIGIWFWIIQIAQRAMSEIEELPEGESIPLMNILGLLDDPNILHIAQSLLPQLSNNFREGLENQYRFLVHIPSNIGTILQGLEPEDQPSLRVKEFLERELARDYFTLEVKRE